MAGSERGALPSRSDDEDEEVLQASLAAAMSAGDDEQIATLRELLTDPNRAARRDFQRQYDRHVRHQEANQRHPSDEE
ncbi:MAG TPA: hypothetical protein VFH54_16970 [Mycobacteriales bacterium]|nr:hypothetical protein [Mycobacteriales bacterium]